MPDLAEGAWKTSAVHGVQYRAFWLHEDCAAYAQYTPEAAAAHPILSLRTEWCIPEPDGDKVYTGGLYCKQ